MDNNPQLRVVTIDGPSGGGKSTVSRRLAAALGFTYLDTGAMYRAVALACQRMAVDVGDQAAVAAVLEDMAIELGPARSPDADVDVLLNKEHVGSLLRTPEMGMLASRISVHPAVREKLTDLQREIGVNGDVVAEGRDTGTVVFPDAAWKFYLEASAQERARRRARQLRQRGEQVDEQELLEQLIQRDQNDSSRQLAPLKPAADAVHIDSTLLSIEEVVDQMLSLIRPPLSAY